MKKAVEAAFLLSLVLAAVVLACTGCISADSDKANECAYARSLCNGWVIDQAATGRIVADPCDEEYRLCVEWK